MRVALTSDSTVIGRTLSDMLAQLRCEIMAPDIAGIPQLRFQKGVLELQAPDGSVHPLPRPASLRTIATELQKLQHSARGAPLPLGHGWRLEPLARMLHDEKGQHVPLTEKESLLLAALYAALPGSASREHLLKEVWSYAHESETHTLETHIYRLRHKLAELTPVPADIITSDGTYRLAMEA